ncbi:DUF2794 domain-containing protein [Abyssibius alkaniclasticus]|uniref:DUF2794 domain-containing protein n=1 Tax=Abyssibius alkaniclasticus TaxID=2881234 RepID=UPI002363278A|nr:DUF2794 domain-containing protein [Abyssibius alkaniclasticus]UPH72399.1 DUF2794 domain-containing protein [Abyssibius alkaniclasticus]
MALIPHPATSPPFGQSAQISFHRSEIAIILSVYGRFVAAGLWRDYGISALRDYAVFSIFRHTAEQPLFRVEKRPGNRLRQGQYSVIGMDGRTLKRGDDLAQVMRIFDRQLMRAV